MPYVPNLESSSQIMDETTVHSEQQQDRVEIDATPASAVKQRKNRRKKRFSQVYMVNSNNIVHRYIYVTGLAIINHLSAENIQFFSLLYHNLWKDSLG